jgi:hypothetical protein
MKYLELSCEPHEIVITVEESLLSNHFTILRDKGLGSWRNIVTVLQKKDHLSERVQGIAQSMKYKYGIRLKMDRNTRSN